MPIGGVPAPIPVRRWSHVTVPLGKDTTVIRRLLLVAATVLGIAVVVPGQANAYPHCKAGYTCLYQWWADSAHTIFNGYLSIGCDGTSESEGTHTGYLEFHESICR
jgi:hypothetical protein